MTFIVNPASHCLAETSSQNVIAWADVVPTPAQYGSVTWRTPLNCLEGMWSYPHDVIIDRNFRVNFIDVSIKH